MQLALRQAESKGSGVLDSNKGNGYLHELYDRSLQNKARYDHESQMDCSVWSNEVCDEQYLVHAANPPVRFKQQALDPDIDIEPVSARPSPMYPSHLTIGPIWSPCCAMIYSSTRGISI